MEWSEYSDTVNLSVKRPLPDSNGSGKIKRSKSHETQTCDPQDPLELLAENVFEVEINLSVKASKNQDGVTEAVNLEMALRNTSGGIIKLRPKKNKPGTVENMDGWVKKWNTKQKMTFLSEGGDPESLAQIIDFEKENLLVFVRKSSVISIESDTLYQRCDSGNYAVKNYPQICKMMEKKTTTCCCANENNLAPFYYGSEFPLKESLNVEFKKLKDGESISCNMRKQLRKNIVAFANTCGGTVYFGIEDNGIVEGQNIENSKAISDSIKECMESKLWISRESGEEIKPFKGSNYEVHFIEVQGTEETDEKRFVVIVHICQFDGTVFLDPPVCKIVKKGTCNEIVNMEFKEWLALHKPAVTPSNRNYQERFKKREYRTSVYFSVKETVEKFVEDLTMASPGDMRLHPQHAVKWINNQALHEFVKLIKKIFKQNKWKSGIAYIEKCWEVNLGLPSTKPADVICDVLICSPQMPLVLVSLTQSAIPTKESRLYNKKLATRLKTTLVQEAGCLEKFYVKPITVSQEQLAEDMSWICSENPIYPNTYGMDDMKYSKIVEALVLVLARANVMATHIIGQGLYNLLTYEQYNILHEFYEESQKVKITGPPGSGKTVLALERIGRLRNGGCLYDEVLFLCAYKPLKANVE